MRNMTLNYNVKKPEARKNAFGENRRVVAEFQASGKPVAQVNLFGRNHYTVATGMRRAIRNKKNNLENISCIVSKGNVYLVRMDNDI